MSRVTYVPKACAYVTRDEGRQLLVFRGPNRDDYQIPKGTLGPREPPVAGVKRELREETGLSGLPDPRWVTSDLWHRRAGRKYVRHFFHLPVSHDRDEWVHRVTGDGPEAGSRFHCEWLDRPLDRPLAFDCHDHLERLPSPHTTTAGGR